MMVVCVCVVVVAVLGEGSKLVCFEPFKCTGTVLYVFLILFSGTLACASRHICTVTH